MPILCVGLTPTVQRTLRFSSPITLGEVNRAQEVFVTASGKAVNVVRVITQMGGAAKLLTVLGGDSGQWILETLTASGIAVKAIWADDDRPTRTCVTLLSEKMETTEIVEESAPISTQTVETVKKTVEAYILDKISALCLSGSLPIGASPDLYADWMRMANRNGIPAFVDAQGEPLRLALAEKPFLVKPNLTETQRTYGLKPTDDTEDDLRVAASVLLDAGAQWALVTNGGAAAFLACAADKRVWRIVPPEIAVVNPIGAGDSLLAGLIWAFLNRKETMHAAAKWGIACAAANCLTATSGNVEKKSVEQLFETTVLQELAALE